MSGDLTLNDLIVTERTAKHHVENIMAKLGVLSRTEIGVWAVGHGLTPTSAHCPEQECQRLDTLILEHGCRCTRAADLIHGRPLGIDRGPRTSHI
jgi:hypothetical protein